MLLGLYLISFRIKQSGINDRRTSLLRVLIVGGDGRGCNSSLFVVLASCASARRALLRRGRCGRSLTPRGRDATSSQTE